MPAKTIRLGLSGDPLKRLQSGASRPRVPTMATLHGVSSAPDLGALAAASESAPAPLDPASSAENTRNLSSISSLLSNEDEESSSPRVTTRSASPTPEPVPQPVEDYVQSPTSDVDASKDRFSREGTPVPYPLGLQQLPFSLLDYLREEIRATELEGFQELKTERVTNFLSVPFAVERCIMFGFAICLDSFLYTFTILPLRFCYAAQKLVRNAFILDRRKQRRLAVSHKCDLVKGVLFALACIILHHITDASQMYHSVRGQETLKLYVIFNVLEIADRLCCSFGQDLFDSLFSRSTLGRRHDGSQPHMRPLALFALCVLYTLAHTLVLFYQLVTLNVAINYWSNALITLLLSNQFVEIKGAVFKKFEKENLFQMTCADIVERFQLALMLSVIALRNLIEISGSTFAMLPASYIPLSVIPSFSAIQPIFAPALIVICSEMLVDWLKHAFITKFNHIRPAVYGRFTDVLCKDLLTDQNHFPASGHAFVDQSPAVSRRIGLAALPIGCLVVRVVYQALTMLTDTSHVDECAPPRAKGLSVMGGLLGSTTTEGLTTAVLRWLVIGLTAFGIWSGMVVVKLLLGINLRAFAANRVATMADRASEDDLNDRNRQPIGMNAAEKAAEERIRSLLRSPDFDSPSKLNGRLVSSTSSIGNGYPQGYPSRYDMIKSRVW